MRAGASHRKLLVASFNGAAYDILNKTPVPRASAYRTYLSVIQDVNTLRRELQTKKDAELSYPYTTIASCDSAPVPNTSRTHARICP